MVLFAAAAFLSIVADVAYFGFLRASPSLRGEGPQEFQLELRLTPVRPPVILAGFQNDWHPRVPSSQTVR